MYLQGRIYPSSYIVNVCKYVRCVLSRLQGASYVYMYSKPIYIVWSVKSHSIHSAKRLLKNAGVKVSAQFAIFQVVLYKILDDSGLCFYNV